MISDNIVLENLEEVVKKSKLLNDFYTLYKDDYSYKELILENKIAFSMSYFIVTHTLMPTIEGKNILEKAWKNFCIFFNKDYNQEYLDIGEITSGY